MGSMVILIMSIDGGDGRTDSLAYLPSRHCSTVVDTVQLLHKASKIAQASFYSAHYST